MEGPRNPQEGELESVIGFLNENLRSKNNWSITQEYPTAITKTNLQNIKIITENGKVLSHALWRPIIVRTPLGLFKVAVVGSVVTHSQYRQKGLSKKIIESCLDSARKQGCDFALLWTNLYDFYKKFGFELAGSEWVYFIEKKLEGAGQNIKIVEGNMVSPEAVLKLYNTHTVNSIRSIEDIRNYLQIPNSRIYTAWGSDNKLLAYAVEGKGADLDAHVHEWAGNMKPLFSLINYIEEKQKRRIHLMVPSHSQALMRKLEEQKIRSNLGFLGMIKLLNPKNIFSKLIRQAKVNYGINDLVLQERENEFVFGTIGDTYSTKCERDMVELIFGPNIPSEIHSFSETTGKVLDTALPIHMWVWGWDSI